MTTEQSEVDNAFPHVGMPARLALIFLVGLSLSYALVFVFVGERFLTTPVELGASAILAIGLLILSYIDLRHGLLLDVLTLPLAVIGFVFSFWVGDWILSLAGAILGYGLIAGLAFYWRTRRGYEGIGLGDAKLLGAIGAWVGLAGLPIVLLIASGIGILAALAVLQITRLSQERTAIPFGPALALGGWIVWCRIETLLPI